MKKRVVDETPNAELNSLEIKTKKDPKKRKLLPIFLGIGLALAIALFCYLFMDKIINVFEKYGIIESKEEHIIDNSSDDLKTGSAIGIFKAPNDETNLQIYTEEEFAELLANNDEYGYYSSLQNIAKYNCKSSDCYGQELYSPKDNNFKEILIKDGKYYLYNYETKAKKELSLTDQKDMPNPNAVIYNGELYGILFDTYDNQAVYYSLSNDKEYTFDENYGKFDKNFIIEKNDYYLFDYTKNSYTKLPFENDNYSQIMAISYNDVLYGYDLCQNVDNSGGIACSFYFLKSNKIVITGLEEAPYVGPEILNDEMVAGNKLYNLNTGAVIHDFSANFIDCPEDEEPCYYSVGTMGTKNAMYYFVDTDSFDGGYGYLLDKDYQVLLNGERIYIFNMGIDVNGDLIINNVNKDGESTSFSIYDEKGNLISKSKTYKEVLSIYDAGYIAIVDNDNYLKLITSDGKVVAKFVKWTDNMDFHAWLSGYYEYNGIEGIYLVVEESSDSEEDDLEGGYGYEYYYDMENKTTGKIATEIGAYGKPVLYLYPTKKTNVTVTFEYPNLLTTTYPKFKDSWQVTAYPNGDLYDNKGNYYYALYWEELKNHDIDFNEGFYVTKENAIKFLEDKLTTIGLSPKERNEFIMYWLPILEKNGQSLVYFELTEERDFYNKLIINPTPDSLLRLAIHVKKVARKVNIKEQQLQTFKRTGFSAVEWGGVEH